MIGVPFGRPPNVCEKICRRSSLWEIGPHKIRTACMEKGIKRMIKEHYFSVNISGSPKTATSVDKAKRLIQIRMLKVDPNVKLSESNFAQIRFGMEWTGEPVHIEKIDTAYKAVKRYLEEFFDNWKMKIIVKYCRDLKTME